MQETLLKKKIVFTKKQLKEIEEFKVELAKGNVEFAFEGSLLEGKAFLQGANSIVDAVIH